MIKMILADDEPVITRGIRKLLDWQALGIEIIGEYEDGISAFRAIVREQPEIALLDISMPGMSGVDIIRECRGLPCRTHIIFISGFQEFEYAKAALDYGAADYLLKPVIRQELLGAVEKCMAKSAGEGDAHHGGEEPAYRGDLDFAHESSDRDMTYMPVCAYSVLNKEENEQVRHLLRFSLLSFLEDYFEENKGGIVFQKENRIVMVLCKKASENRSEELEKIKEGAEQATGHGVLLICGAETASMREIPELFQKCVEREGYLFFADQMKYSVIDWKEPPFQGRADAGAMEEAKEAMAEGILTHRREAVLEGLEKFGRMVCRMSMGRKEDALFYYCTALRELEETLSKKGIRAVFLKSRELLEKGRSCHSFGAMEKIFAEEICRAYDCLGASVAENDKRDIHRAVEYIETHYGENLSLNVLAEEIHMNPYYFSSFFKKSTGRNFKDYVNQVRLKHGVELLLTTDKKIYEIAMDVGFGDARAFTDAFQKSYGETPAGYRKKLRDI